MSDGTVLGIALVWVALATFGFWWLWRQRRSGRSSRLKKALMVVVGLACLLASSNTEKVSTTLTVGFAGVLALLSAFFLRHRPPTEPPPPEPER